MTGIEYITDLCRILGIRFVRYSDSAELLKNAGLGDWLTAKGFVCRVSGGRYMIFFDDSQSRQEICYTIARELGHILQGHLCERGTSTAMEQEADSTAAVLMDLIYGPEWQNQMDTHTAVRR